jgi:hypothetical protein
MGLLGPTGTYWDLTSAGLSLGNRAMDPDLAVGTNSLYVSADSVGSGGLVVVVRIPLSEIQAATTIHFDFTNPATRAEPMAPILSQNTGDTVLWAGHVNASTICVLSMKEGENRYSWRKVDHDS